MLMCGVRTQLLKRVRRAGHREKVAMVLFPASQRMGALLSSSVLACYEASLFFLVESSLLRLSALSKKRQLFEFVFFPMRTRR